MQAPSLGGTRQRIMFLIRTLSGAGAELVVESLCSGLDPKLFEVSVCELSGHGEKAQALRASGFRVFSLSPDGNRLSLPRTLYRLRQIIVGHKINLLHSHSTDALAAAATCALTVHGMRHVHTFHFGNYPNHTPTHLLLERIFHRFADQLVAVGHVQADALAQTYGIQRSSIQVIWNGVEVRRERIDHEQLAPYTQGGKILIGTIGTLIPQKGHEDLIAVAAMLKGEKLPVMFIVVGGGPLRDELEAMVRKSQLEDTVAFLGWVKDAAETVLPAIDIFFQPSRWEAMSMVLLEAAAAGKAIVCTSVGEASRIIVHGQSGLVVQPADHASMANALGTLVKDSNLRNRLGRAAQQGILDRCSAAKMVSSYEDLYRRVLHMGS